MSPALSLSAATGAYPFDVFYFIRFLAGKEILPAVRPHGNGKTTSFCYKGNMSKSAKTAGSEKIQFLTLDPGHFHAALVQKEMYPQVAPQVHIYAPLGPDLLAHLARIAGFNGRAADPTAWELEIHTGADYRRRLFTERPGNVLVLAGRNAAKIGAIEEAVAAGLNVLADKPWIIAAADLPRLQSVLDEAGRKGLVVYDIMTERHEVTSVLQRELINDADVFGTIVAGTREAPGVAMESVHYLKKTVAGVPLRRPAWFFDTQQQGEGLSDVGTHLVDLVPWLFFQDQALDYRHDIQVLAARRWPTFLTRADFQQITGEADFPVSLRDRLQDGRLAYSCNNQVSYTVRGIHIKLDVLWDLEAADGGDTHLASFRGTRGLIKVCQGRNENFKPELYVVPDPGEKHAVCAALRHKIAALQAPFPGIGLEDRGAALRVVIPEAFRVGHEAHFGEVTRQFLRYVQKQEPFPAWENPNMLAKYHVTTQGVELASKSRS